ncbi:hypothetical protein [Pseudomonas phage PIP]|nr:hypothetical protein [Pseudomonas phage PIP]
MWWNSPESKEKTRTIHDAVREAVGSTRASNPSAVEDVLQYGERMSEFTKKAASPSATVLGTYPAPM